MKLTIKEDFKSRKWQSLIVLKAGLRILKRLGVFSILFIIIGYCLLNHYKFPKQCYGVLVFPAFPLIFSFSFFIFHPFLLFPQQWDFYDDKIRFKGIREYGTLKFKYITSWEINEIPELENYHVLNISWKKWLGIQKGRLEIFIPTTETAEDLTELLKKSTVFKK